MLSILFYFRLKSVQIPSILKVLCHGSMVVPSSEEFWIRKDEEWLLSAGPTASHTRHLHPSMPSSVLTGGDFNENKEVSFKFFISNHFTIASTRLLLFLSCNCKNCCIYSCIPVKTCCTILSSMVSLSYMVRVEEKSTCTGT